MGAIIVSTPGFPIGAETPHKGFDERQVRKILEKEVKLGARFCMPHQSTTDAMVDRCSRSIRQMDQLCAWFRECGLIPGLSTHMPESIIYADETKLDVETYISIYNSMGFLMQVEVDWIAKVIREAKKPVMTIKPMAAGQLATVPGTYLRLEHDTSTRHGHRRYDDAERSSRSDRDIDEHPGTTPVDYRTAGNTFKVIGETSCSSLDALLSRDRACAGMSHVCTRRASSTLHHTYTTAALVDNRMQMPRG